MAKPTGKLKFAYESIANLERKVKQLEQERDELKAHCSILEIELEYHIESCECGHPKICEVCKDNKDINDLLTREIDASLHEIQAQAIEEAANRLLLLSDKAPSDSVTEEVMMACVDILREYAKQKREGTQ